MRPARESEIDALARIWHEGWHESHASLVPAELTQLRTFESFRDRLRAALPEIRVIGSPGEPLGFSVLKADELYQLFVAAPARGSGAAAALIADAEARLSARGVRTAWLACAIGNTRAARFYEKCGWHLAGTILNDVDTSSGTFPLEVWRYEKALDRQNLNEYWNFPESLLSCALKRRLRLSTSSCTQPWLKAMKRSLPGFSVQRTRLCQPRFFDRLSYWIRFENDSDGEAA